MKTVGIIVGRFQVSELHEGHIGLIRNALENFDKTIIFIGEKVVPLLLNFHDPLPFVARRSMILEQFPELDGCIYKINDIGNWPLWVKKLDEIIDGFKESGVIDKDAKVYICGSRDSVASRYKEFDGKNYVHFFEEVGNKVSGTERRKELAKFMPTWNKGMREMLIWLCANFKIE